MRSSSVASFGGDGGTAFFSGGLRCRPSFQFGCFFGGDGGRLLLVRLCAAGVAFQLNCFFWRRRRHGFLLVRLAAAGVMFQLCPVRACDENLLGK
jgi:hypothetical protein